MSCRCANFDDLLTHVPSAPIILRPLITCNYFFLMLLDISPPFVSLCLPLIFTTPGSIRELKSNCSHHTVQRVLCCQLKCMHCAWLHALWALGSLSARARADCNAPLLRKAFAEDILPVQRGHAEPAALETRSLCGIPSGKGLSSRGQPKLQQQWHSFFLWWQPTLKCCLLKRNHRRFREDSSWFPFLPLSLVIV